MSAHGEVDPGHTVAGWTGTVIACAGTAGAGAAMCAAWVPGIWLGLGVTAVGALVTWVLHLTGWGKPPGPRTADQWPWRIRDRTATEGHGDCAGCRLALRTAGGGELARTTAAPPESTA
ncbi:HGxxPAAW family protein [Streptomyces sp. NPDC087420]|uniref:HGxxPAAW family protein n=1 Tax=Streptomyces sp. NPDC087420 TaxID=3365785 RepID=UPI0038399120